MDTVTTETAAEETTAKTTKKKAAAEKAAANASGFWVYIGPTIRGAIQHGAVFFGDRAAVLSDPVVAAAIAKSAYVQTLIVSGDTLPEDRLKVKEPGSALWQNAQRVASGK